MEREFLDFLEAHALRLPARAQHFYEDYKTRPDFSYIGDNPAFIYVDGPPHDYPDRQERDKEQTAIAAGPRELRSSGFTIGTTGLKSLARHPSIFGEAK